ncbi:MAG: DNA repair protein RecO [Bacilli bacterium]|nr:DNA repair protein RecO [Bacilli bacterium]
MKTHGYIVRVSPYRDSGAMINVLGPRRLFAFYANNTFKLDKKNSLLATPLMGGEFTFNDTDKQILTFKEFAPTFDTRKYIHNFNQLALINFVNEITLLLFSEEDMPLIYPYLDATLALIEQKEKLPMLALTYLAAGLRLSGNGLEVDRCVLTGSTMNIIGVSFEEGGFISREAFLNGRHRRYSPNKCRILRQIFKAEPQNLKDLDFNIEEGFEVLNDLFTYAYDQTGIRFKSADLVMKMK